MKKLRRMVLALALTAAIIAPSSDVKAVGDEAYRFFVTSDTHYLSASLHDDSETFLRFESSGDGKMIAYSSAIISAFANDAISRKPDAVFITGDLTLNGEAKSHEELAELLAGLREQGINVLVIPGNHDINNPSASEIKAEGITRTEYISPEEFAEIYNDFGYGGALFHDEYSLSYISRLDDGLYAIMLDTAMYYSNIENNASTAGGKVYDETLEWIQTVIESIRADEPDAKFMTFSHHNLFAHNRNFDMNYVIGRAPRLRTRFEELGLSVFFSGHIHIQDILEQEINGRALTEIVSGAISVYPVTYGVGEIVDDELNYYTQWVDMEAYAAKNEIKDKNLLEFKEYAKAAFKDRAVRRMEQTLRDLKLSEDDINEAVGTLRMLNAYYFAGEIDLAVEDILSSRGYEVITEHGLSANRFNTIFEDGGGENNRIKVNLDTGK